ncbi:zinc-binding dehydrogenase [Nocardia veterana]|uniref:Zinc-binding dehydrogenase n=1 Tax=Nocardia veterana TaxID=132249 RepID=A0A7X6RH53_9NOCA|nr:zinc-binding dehydrogenase [Nocardia veterana]NKY85655.1 zinc-binding dehydrogenase [Nocardia veterana]
MRAAVLREFGGPEALAVADIDIPRPGPGEVLVRVRASSANPVDGLIRRGVANPKLTLPAVIGSDVAGEVEQVGPGVTDVAVGDAVYYTSELVSGGGAYAQYHVAAAAIVAPKPSTLSYPEAAAIPLAGGTAWEAIVRRLNVLPGQTVLVHGGSGGVGSFAVQFARAAGASVLATAGPDHQQLLRDLGATPIDYKSEDFIQVARAHTDGAGVDAVLDTVGGENLAGSAAATRAGGRIATILAPDGRLDDLYQRNQTLYGIFLTRERRRLTEMTPLFDRGVVRPQIAEVMPLDDIVAIHRRLDEGHNAGKLVVDVP